MTYGCPAWELATDTYLLKLQRLQNKVLHITGNFLRWTPVRDLYAVFNLPDVYNYKQKSYKTIKMNMLPVQDKVKPDTENIRGLITLDRVEAYDRSSEQAAVVAQGKIGMICFAKPHFAVLDNMAANDTMQHLFQRKLRRGGGGSAVLTSSLR
jgi:hypothetical protein